MSAPTGSADPADAVARGGIGWLHEHLAWFDPRQWERFLPRRGFPASPLLELALLLRCLRRGPYAGLAGPLVEDGLDLAERVVAREKFRDGLHRADATFAYHAYLVCLLAGAGRDTAGLAESVRHVVTTNAGDVRSADRPALSLMELRHALDIGGISGRDTALPAVAQLYPRSIVAARHTPLSLRDDETYALTHVLLYLTDFGARPAALEPAEHRRVLELVLVLLAACLARGDLDLGGELLLCAQALGAGRHDLLDHGWQVTAGALREDGAVPSPLHDPQVLSTAEGERAAAYLFGTCFHTTMVATMAASERRRRALAG